MAISLVAEITQKAATLPFELQRETLHFIEFIAQRPPLVNGHAQEIGLEAARNKSPFKSVLGSLEHLNVRVTEADLSEVRCEMWANFPREEPR